MSEVVLDQIRKVYAGGVEAVRGVDIRDRRPVPSCVHRRPVRLRQVDSAAHDRGA